MSVLWTSAEAEAATGGRARCPFAATGVSIDSRSIAPGDLFVVLKDARDRHDFVAAAVVNGLMEAQMKTGVPVFSVSLTPHHFQPTNEHVNFFGQHFLKKGAEAAQAVLGVVSIDVDAPLEVPAEAAAKPESKKKK